MTEIITQAIRFRTTILIEICNYKSWSKVSKTRSHFSSLNGSLNYKMYLIYVHEEEIIQISLNENEMENLN